jgi:hypothetical protein
MFKFLRSAKCVYCLKPINVIDRVLRNVYAVSEDGEAHVKCRVEPKVGE